MQRYRIINKERFEMFKKILLLILLIVLSVLFVKFMNVHSGIKPKTIEYHTYEIVQETSQSNHRVKTPVLREVVYKTVYR